MTANSCRAIRAVAVGVAATVVTPLLSGANAVDVSKLPPAAARMINFAREVRPIFEKNCYTCHGPEKQKSGYRLDVKEDALTGGDGSGPNIIPGKSAESHLVHFVAGLDEDRLMPSKGDPLTPEQIGVLRAWIDQGAVWPEESARVATKSDGWKTHWSFQPLRRPAVPGGSNQSAVISNPGKPITPTNPIDSFLSAKLAENGLTLSPEADRRTLIRRLSFDLIGLPPTPEEIAGFLGDKAPDAYDRLVDRLLASPHYGERWGRHWLDVVRFAESDGYQRNNMRANAWPYRDYVIEAFNTDKPYDQFVREQVAGDAYGVDAATGFIVGGAWDILRLIDPPTFDHQQRADELYDMVATTGSTFMGLTVGCARCHDHKFDPISQQDFYALTAVFQGVFHGERPMRPANHEAIAREVANPKRRVAEIDAVLAPFVARSVLSRTVLIEESGEGTAIAFAAGTERGQAGDRGDELRLPTPSEGARGWKVHPGALRDVSPWTTAVAGRFRIWVSWSANPTHAGEAIYVLDHDGDPDTTGDQTELGRVDQSRFADGKISVTGEQRWSGFRALGVHTLTPQSRILLRSGGSGGMLTADTLLLEEVTTEAETDPTATPHLRGPVVPKANEERFPPVAAKFVRFTITATNDGDAALDEVEVFPVSPAHRNLAHMEWGTKATASRVNGRDGNPFYIHDGVFHEVGNWTMPVTEPVWVQLEFAQIETINRVVWSRNRSDRGPKAAEHGLPTQYRIEVSTDGVGWQPVASSADRLPEAYRKRVPSISTLSGVPLARAGEFPRLADQRRGLQERIAQATAFPSGWAGKFREPGPTYRLHRGEVTAKRERLAPAAIAYFGPKLELPVDTPEQKRRVALADWLTNPANPLAARVIVNRVWHYHFGTGIVDTPSDFGINGGRPTHPELLDWLAAEFMARGWRLKELHRLIVNSSAYRQAAAPRPEGLAADSGTRLLWRYPPRRIEAEALRDAMLAVSGQLNPRAGGPGFSLFLTDLNNSHNTEVFIPKTKFEPDEYRRMVYQEKPRVQLDDVFGAFDCPDAGGIAPARTSTTTPLQAFNLLNSAFALQQAAALAARLEKEAGSERGAQIERAFLLALCRLPEVEERAEALALIARHGLPLFCRSLYNSNEFIFVY
ncbi:MAG: DUF1553 domain-containing protein [Opitutus sp.]|nr:DUF1553 domain-containing protein [Opitutus sp.]